MVRADYAKCIAGTTSTLYQAVAEAYFPRKQFQAMLHGKGI